MFEKELDNVQEVHCFFSGGRVKTDSDLNFVCQTTSIYIDSKAEGDDKNKKHLIHGPFIKDAAYERYLSYDPQYPQPRDSPTLPPKATPITTRKSSLEPELSLEYRDNPINSHKYNHMYHETIWMVLCGLFIALALMVVIALVYLRRTYIRNNRSRRNYRRFGKETA